MIDIHTHLAYYKLYPERFLGGTFSSVENQVISSRKFVSIVKLFFKDQKGIQLIKQMDEAEIEKSILLIVDNYNALGKTGISIEDNYILHREILKNNPERFIVFAGFHPGRGEYGMKLLKTGIESYGFAGVKLYPPFGFRMDDSRLASCYEYCSTKHLPVLIHTGYSFDGLQNSYAEPDALINICDKYEDIKFIMAHAGYKLSNPTISELLLKKNVYADISGFQSVLDQDDTKSDIDLIFQEPYNSKLLFGSDWPIKNIIKPLSHQINVLKKLYENCENKAENAFENLMKQNAKKLLNI